MRLKLIFFLSIAAFLLATCADQQPQMAIETGDANWGHVINGEILSRDLTVSNDGAAPLVIESIVTSCSCTTAKLSPMTIEPGAQGTLHIEFDSGAHGPELTGELMRQVFITSNDPQQPEAQIDFTIFVDPKPS